MKSFYKTKLQKDQKVISNTIKRLFGKIRKRSKKLCLEKKLQKYENNIKTTWKIIK